MSEPIKIIRVIADEVTAPRNDGTPGCALYCVPLELSGHPSAEWERAFIEAWNHPTSYSSMHRPGIASVRGRKILLNGTTLEEVDQTHKPVLAAAVQRANQHVEQYELAQARRKAEAEQAEAERRKHVEAVAAKIKFD